MQVPIDRLDAETLRRVIEEYISREGSDYGLQSLSLSSKVEQVQSQLKSGRAVLCYDETSESCQILSKEDWRRQ